MANSLSYGLPQKTAKGEYVRRIPIEQLKPGMVIAKAIYNSDGGILLHSGIKLTETFINRLSSLSIVSVYIKDSLFDDSRYQDVISEETRLATIVAVKASFSNLENERRMNMGMVQAMVDNILDELLENPHVLVNLSDIRLFDDYTFAHSVNVCVLALLTAIVLGYDKVRLKELGIGALLHDIGKTRIDKEILNKPDDLSKEEFEEIKRHTEYGFEILRQYPDVSLLASHIALQHHERWDGFGYPRALSGENIHEYARITAVADVYDALLADRPYRPSYTINQAITIIKRMSVIYLDERCVNALVANVAVYPLGSIVQLNTGDYGVIIDVNQDTPTRPVIKVFCDKHGRRLAQNHEIDLSKLSTIIVFKILGQEEIERLLG